MCKVPDIMPVTDLQQDAGCGAQAGSRYEATPRDHAAREGSRRHDQHRSV